LWTEGEEKKKELLANMLAPMITDLHLFGGKKNISSQRKGGERTLSLWARHSVCRNLWWSLGPLPPTGKSGKVKKGTEWEGIWRSHCYSTERRGEKGPARFSLDTKAPGKTSPCIGRGARGRPEKEEGEIFGCIKKRAGRYVGAVMERLEKQGQHFSSQVRKMSIARPRKSYLNWGGCASRLRGERIALTKERQKE